MIFCVTDTLILSRRTGKYHDVPKLDYYSRREKVISCIEQATAQSNRITFLVNNKCLFLDT